MSIVAGQNGLASDFVGTSSGAGDSGKVAKLDAQGKIPYGFTYQNYQAFTSTGTWTKPTGLTGNELVVVKLWGGGAGGNSGAPGGGGGGGAYFEFTIRVGLLGSTETVTVGAAVAAAAGGNNSSFGSWATAYGGGSGAATGGGGRPSATSRPRCTSPSTAPARTSGPASRAP